MRDPEKKHALERMDWSGPGKRQYANDPMRRHKSTNLQYLVLPLPLPLVFASSFLVAVRTESTMLIGLYLNA